MAIRGTHTLASQTPPSRSVGASERRSVEASERRSVGASERFGAGKRLYRPLGQPVKNVDLPPRTAAAVWQAMVEAWRHRARHISAHVRERRATGRLTTRHL
jgi:hypothetical protein